MPFEPVQFGKYTLYEKLAVGGMALLYRARIQGVKGFQKDLVIKQILPQYSGMNDFIDMFIDEAKIAVNLNHANIVPVYELGEIDGQLYIAMEYVAGRDLQAILEACEDKKTTVPPRMAAYILMGLCRGLDYAHNKKDDATRQPLNIIHRDISPNNVIVSYEGEIKIIDFGIAKASIKVSVTQFGTLKGKMIYMSPEQAAEQKLDPRSDVFSAGILLYEMVTGKKPYGGDNFALTQENVKKAVFLPPDKVKPDLPPAMTQIILKAMERNPDDRYGSAFDLERALTDFLFSTGQNVYARDVSAFLQDLFTERTDEKSLETKSGVRNLTDGGSESSVTTDTVRAPSPGSLTPTSESSLSKPVFGEVPAEAPSDQGSAAAILGALPDEGPAIDEGTDSSPGAAAPSAAPAAAPDGAPTPTGPGSRVALLGDEPFEFEIPPPPAAAEEPAPSQRETVVTRRLPARNSVPGAPPDGPTPPPVAGREGVVPALGRGGATTRTSPSATRDGRPVAGETAEASDSGPGIPAADLAAGDAGVVPMRHAEEETAPGAATARSAPPPPPSRTSPTAPGVPRPAAAAPATARPSPVRDATPPRPTPVRGVVPPRPATAETPVSPAGGRPNPLTAPPPPPPPASAPAPAAKAPPPPPSMASPPRGTPVPPWQTGPSAAEQPPPPKRGLLDRIVGRRTTQPSAPNPPPSSSAGPAPAEAEDPALEGFYESPADFLTNHYATYGDARGLFLSTTHLDAKLGVDIPLRLQFANPPSSFLVHGRVIWRRAKEGTSKGKRLPAGLAIEFVEDLSDELEALFAYLGLP